jgi:hypothetical protein
MVEFKKSNDMVDLTEVFNNYKDPKELFDWMKKNIHYDNKATIVRTPQQVLNDRCGICFDQMEFERVYMQFKHIDYRRVFICLSDKNSIIQNTHTYLYYVIKDKYIYFENAWDKYKGIKEFNNEQMLLDTIESRFRKEYKQYTIYYQTYINFTPKPGMTIHDYIIQAVQ